MAKIIYNRCYGGFGISREAVLLARQISGDPQWHNCVLKGETDKHGNVLKFDLVLSDIIPRHDPVLVEVVEKLGSKKASGDCAKLAITDISSGTMYRIDEYVGKESVMTNDDYEWSVAP